MIDRDRGPMRWVVHPGKAVAVGGIALIEGVGALQASRHQPGEARRIQAPVAAEAEPHKAPNTIPMLSTTTTTLGDSIRSATGANAPDVAEFDFNDGYKASCEVERTVKVKSSQDTLFAESTRGLNVEGDSLPAYVYRANLDYNREENGISLGDLERMRPGDTYTLLGDCMLRSPNFGSGQNTSHWVADQANQSVYYYNGASNDPSYCVPEPVCERSTPSAQP